MVLPLSGLKWHEKVVRNSRLLLPIVGWGRWSIVLNRSDFSCCNGSNSLIPALLQDLLILQFWNVDVLTAFCTLTFVDLAKLHLQSYCKTYVCNSGAVQLNNETIHLLTVCISQEKKKKHEILGREYPGDQGDRLPCSREKSFVNALRPPGFEFSWNTRSKTLPCSV